MIVRRAVAMVLLLCALSSSAIAMDDQSGDFQVKCMFADPALAPQAASTIPLNWKFNSRLFGIFGPGVVRANDPTNLLGTRVFTRVTAKGSMIYFAATQSPNYGADDTALFIGIMKSPDGAHFPLGTVLASSNSQFVKKNIGHCSFEPIDSKPSNLSDAVRTSNAIFDSLISYYRTELGQ